MLSKDYINDPRMSQSKLKVILKGVDKFKWELDHPTEPTDPMILGSAVHVLVLEKEKAKDLIIKIPKLNGSTREGKIFKLLRNGHTPDHFRLTKNKTKKQGLGFYEVDNEELDFAWDMYKRYEHVFYSKGEKIFLKEDDYETAVKMAENVWNNTATRKLLETCNNFEKIYRGTYCVSSFFNLDKPIDFKAQVDADSDSDDFIDDLKSTSIDLSDDDKIEEEIRKRGYDYQAALYLILSGKSRYFITFVSNEEPHTVRTVRLSERTLDAGLDKVNISCRIYNECLLTNREFKSDYGISEI